MAKVVLKLDDDGDLPVFTRHVSGIERDVQKVRTRLLRVPGEVVLDAEAGLDLLGWLQQRPPDTATIAAEIRADLEEIDTVNIAQVAVEFVRSTQSLLVTGTVYTQNGQLAIQYSPSARNTFPGSVLVIIMGAI